MGSRLPTCGLPSVADAFAVPSRAVLELVEALRCRGFAHERERALSPLGWRTAEFLRSAAESRALEPLVARLRGAGWFRAWLRRPGTSWSGPAVRGVMEGNPR